MNITSLISFIAAFFSISLGIFVLYRNKRLFVHRIFAFGMAILAAEAIFTGLCSRSVIPVDVINWLQARYVATAILPGVWFIFSLSFSRLNYKDILSKWKWVTIALFILPLATIILFRNSLFNGEPLLSPSSTWIVNLGWPGYAFHSLILVSATLILMNLERTLRNSMGYFRWQIKFMILGISCIFAFKIYVVSHTMLFHSINLALEFVNDAAVIVATPLIVRSLLRTRLLNVDFYMSQTFIYNSITILLVGVYLIAVGTLAKLILYFKVEDIIPFKVPFILLAFLMLVILILSDRLRKKTKRFISKHFKRPIYDYREEWMKFSRSTTYIMDMKNLCDIIVKLVSNTFDTLSVTLWILDDSKDKALLGASTAFRRGERDEIEAIQSNISEFAHFINEQNIPYDFDYMNDKPLKENVKFDKEFFQKLQIRYCLPLIAGNSLLGLMTLDNRVGASPLTVEDFDLLKVMADQSAANLLNLMLSEQLREAKEMEALRKMSTFFIHDLKNLASKLSLTMQNLPTHFDNPEFRNDALHSISQSVEKINLMSNRLTSLSQKIELNLAQVNLNTLVSKTISTLDVSLKNKIVEDYKRIPDTLIDSEQIQKVLTNLILNAYEASARNGNIIITTGRKDGWAFFSVQDNGCGISKEFMETSLFQAFKTTKKNGMGIGLLHSKSIIEAHKGKIEVESEEGRGSTFKVMLPINSK